MDLAEHRSLLRAAAASFAHDLDEAADSGALGVTVPTCPEWTVADLAAHVGGIYRWVTALVREGIVVETWRSDLPITYPADAASSAEWFRASVDPLIEALDGAPPERRVFVWGADPHARFWSRRLHHETTVHLVDLRLALGRPATLDPAAAVDAIDELLTNLPSTARWGAPLELLRGNGETLSLRATDAGESWRLRFEPTGCWWDRSDADAGATLRGTASSLLLHLLGRPGDVSLTGDRDVLESRRAALAF